MLSRLVVPLTSLGLGLALAAAVFAIAALRPDNGEGGRRRPTPIERLLSHPDEASPAQIILTEPREPFLEDVPRFPGSQLVAAVIFPDETPAYQVLWEANASPERVMAYLKDHLQTEGGWTVEDVPGAIQNGTVINLCRDGETAPAFGTLTVGPARGQASTEVRLFYSTGESGPCTPHDEGGFPSIELPHKVPAYPGALLHSSGSSSGGDRTSLEYVYSADASVTDVADFYESALAAEGWRLAGSAATSDAAVISFDDAAAQVAGFVMIVANDVTGNTEIRAWIVQSGP
jgi:hypothetical protein